MNIETIQALKERAKEMLNNDYSRKIGDEVIYTIICEWENAVSELETYKKISEKLALFIIKIGTDETEICKYEKCLNYKTEELPLGSCMLCIIDWARKEVEKDE